MYPSLTNVAVVIPVRLKEEYLPRLLERLRRTMAHPEIHTIEGNHRAKQMNEGAFRTTKKFIWFLHADSVLEESCFSKLEDSLNEAPEALHYFNLKFDSNVKAPLWMNALGANFRSHILKMPFGDQGFCISREIFLKLKGFDEGAAYGEDHLFVWKARRNGIKIKCTGATLRTSPRKYLINGWLKTTGNHLWGTFRQALPEVFKLLIKSPPEKGAVGIFVKTPGLSPIKTRLAAGVGKKRAEETYLGLVCLTEKVAEKASERMPLVPYWAVAEKGGLNNALWKSFETLEQGEGSLGERLSKVYNELLKKHAYVFLIGADCPGIDEAILAHAEKALFSSNCVLGKTVDGGFYLFGGKVPIPKNVWLRVPYSCSETAEVLLKELERVGPVAELPVLNDVDTVEDLAHFDQANL